MGFQQRNLLSDSCCWTHKKRKRFRKISAPPGEWSYESKTETWNQHKWGLSTNGERMFLILFKYPGFSITRTFALKQTEKQFPYWLLTIYANHNASVLFLYIAKLKCSTGVFQGNTTITTFYSLCRQEETFTAKSDSGLQLLKLLRKRNDENCTKQYFWI